MRSSGDDAKKVKMAQIRSGLITDPESSDSLEPKSKSCRLPMPDTVELSQINWLYTVPIVAIHLLAFAATLPYFFSWTGLIVAVIGVHQFGAAINMCYHRQLTHRSFRTPKWLERFFVVVALCCMQDTPARWVATHRCHHQYSDDQSDPHTPLVNFLWAHVGWLLVRNRGTESLAAYQKYAYDILADPFYMKLEKNRALAFLIYLAHAILFFLIGFALGWWIDGNAAAGVQFGLSLFVWGVLLRTVLVWHVTWSVNSLTHLFGYQTYKTGEHSRNNWLVGVFAAGEGWHNNHHHDQTSASNQRRWWEIDLTYYQIKLLSMVGLATDLVPRRSERLAKAQGQSQAEQGESCSDAADAHGNADAGNTATTMTASSRDAISK
jgi:fatty-acid desaturase